MSDFDPRGSFRADAPLDQDALAVSHAFMPHVPRLAPRDITRGYFHQSASEYGCVDGAYHAVIALRNGVWTIEPSHDVRDNARSTFSEANYAEHTFQRNLGAVGLAVDGLVGSQVSPNDFGAEPLQMHEIERLCAAMAAFCVVYSIDTLGTSDDGDKPEYRGEPNLLTHAEAANRPGVPPPAGAYAYGPSPGTCERWDLSTLIPAPAGVLVTSEHATIVGNELRGRTHRYAAELRG